MTAQNHEPKRFSERPDALNDSGISYPEKSKQIIRLYESDENSADIETAYWFVNTLSDMMPKIPNLENKRFFDQYHDSDFKSRKDLEINKPFMDKVNSHMNELSAAESANSSNLFWLEWTYKILPAPDQINREKIAPAISRLKRAMGLVEETTSSYADAIADLNRVDIHG